MGWVHRNLLCSQVFPTGGLMEDAALPAEHRQLFQKVRYKKRVASFLRNFTVGKR